MRFRAGFTLVELLVVIAIIGILAALLLPTLSKGKTAAQSAACKGNLRQLGIALNLYVSDYDIYPGNGALHSGGIFFGFSGTAGMNWLKPYLGEKYDTNSHFNVTPGALTVFHCPAQKPIPPSPIGIPGATLPDSDYGYNELGTGWKDVRLKLGLGFIIDWLGGQSQSYVRPATIKNPSDLIAIADGDTWLAPSYPYPLGPLEDRPHAGSLFLPHNASANVVFCDAHVEHAKGPKWIEETDSARKRWNNDNQPHPETW